MAESSLEHFFCALKEALPERCSDKKPVEHTLGEGFEIEVLQEFFEVLPGHISAAQQAGFLCDPWAVASLKRDEVRNSAVLAWWLDPKGSHGFGGSLLENLLRGLSGGLPDCDCVSKLCSVRVESCPDGDGRNRVDIEIDDPKFFLIIEVKIGALEGVNQLNRYCDIAEAKARAEEKPWAVVFLTPQGRISASELAKPEKVFRLSWRQLASHLDAMVRKSSIKRQLVNSPERCLTALLARQFSKHVRNF